MCAPLSQFICPLPDGVDKSILFFSISFSRSLPSRLGHFRLIGVCLWMSVCVCERRNSWLGKKTNEPQCQNVLLRSPSFYPSGESKDMRMALKKKKKWNKTRGKGKPPAAEPRSSLALARRTLLLHFFLLFLFFPYTTTTDQQRNKRPPAIHTHAQPIRKKSERVSETDKEREKGRAHGLIVTKG